MCSSALSTVTHTPARRLQGRPHGDVGFHFTGTFLTHFNTFAQELTQFEQPALSVRVEESVREVIAVVLGDLERLVLDALVQVLELK